MTRENATASKDVQQIARMIRNAFEANKGKTFGLQKSLELASKITQSTSWHAIKAAEVKPGKTSLDEKSFQLPRTTSFIVQCDLQFVFKDKAYSLSFEYTEQLIHALDLIRLKQSDHARLVVQAIHEDYNFSMDSDDEIAISIDNLGDQCPLASIDLALIPFRDGEIGVVATGNTDESSEQLEVTTKLDFDSLIKPGLTQFDEYLLRDFEEFMEGEFKTFNMITPASNTDIETLISFRVTKSLLKDAYLFWKKDEICIWYANAHFDGQKATTLLRSSMKSNVITFSSEVLNISVSISLDNLKLIATQPLLACHRGICSPMVEPNWISTYCLEGEKVRAIDSVLCKKLLEKVPPPIGVEIEILARQNNLQDFTSIVLTRKQVLDQIGWNIPMSGRS